MDGWVSSGWGTMKFWLSARMHFRSSPKMLVQSCIYVFRLGYGWSALLSKDAFPCFFSVCARVHLCPFLLSFSDTCSQYFYLLCASFSAFCPIKKCKAFFLENKGMATSMSILASQKRLINENSWRFFNGLHTAFEMRVSRRNVQHKLNSAEFNIGRPFLIGKPLFNISFGNRWKNSNDFRWLTTFVTGMSTHRAMLRKVAFWGPSLWKPTPIGLEFFHNFIFYPRICMHQKLGLLSRKVLWTLNWLIRTRDSVDLFWGTRSGEHKSVKKRRE